MAYFIILEAPIVKAGQILVLSTIERVKPWREGSAGQRGAQLAIRFRATFLLV